MKAGNQIRQTHIRFRIFADYESYINSIDGNYDAEDVIFNGYIYKLSTPQFNKVNRSQYSNGCDFEHEIIEYRGNNGDRVFPRSVTNRDSALYLHNNHFSLIWKSRGIRFNQAVKVLKDTFKIVDNYITEENVNSHFKMNSYQRKLNLI